MSVSQTIQYRVEALRLGIIPFYCVIYSKSEFRPFPQVREEDLKWAQELVRRRDAMKEELAQRAEAEQNEILEKRRGVAADTSEEEGATE